MSTAPALRSVGPQERRTVDLTDAFWMFDTAEKIDDYMAAAGWLRSRGRDRTARQLEDQADSLIDEYIDVSRDLDAQIDQMSADDRAAMADLPAASPLWSLTKIRGIRAVGVRSDTTAFVLWSRRIVTLRYNGTGWVMSVVDMDDASTFTTGVYDWSRIPFLMRMVARRERVSA